MTVIRAKVVGKKLMRDGPFGTMRYTVKQMKVCIMNTGCMTQRQTQFLQTQQMQQMAQFGRKKIAIHLALSLSGNGRKLCLYEP